MTKEEKQELYENICNDINCGTYILAPQYVDKLLAKLERKIAGIRGSHRVDLAKLNARTEQVERLKKENAELKDELKKWKDGIALKDEEKGCETCTKFDEVQLSKAKEIIENLLGVLPDEVLHHDYYKRKYVDPAEQFLKENE